MNLYTIFKNITLPVLIIFSISNYAGAQDYKSSIGGKLGTYVALTSSTYLSEGRSLEFIVGITREANKSNFIFGSFYKFHFDVVEIVPTLTWYAGPGLFLNVKDENGANKLKFSPSVTIGMEYTLEHTPVNFFLDISPQYNINSISDSKFNAHANLGVRYVIDTYD